MLTLGCHPKQTILIGQDIEIKILEHSRGVTRIGITAPRNVKILLGELQERKQCRQPAHHQG